MTRGLALSRNFLRDDGAVTAAEFALVVPFFLLVVFGTINTSILLSAVIQMHYAAERSARCLAVNITTPCTKANIDTYGKDFYNGPPVTTLTFSSPATDPACGKQVTGSGSYNLVSGFSATNVSIRTTACYPVI